MTGIELQRWTETKFEGAANVLLRRDLPSSKGELVKTHKVLEIIVRNKGHNESVSDDRRVYSSHSKT